MSRGDFLTHTVDEFDTQTRHEKKQQRLTGLAVGRVGTADGTELFRVAQCAVTEPPDRRQPTLFTALYRRVDIERQVSRVGTAAVYD